MPATNRNGFDKLFDPLLVLIFVKGVEEELDLTSPCFRTRKQFARLARQVCARWKALIDDHLRTSFWIARLELKLEPHYIRDPPDGTTRSLAFAQSLATFRSQLLTSQGCDLAIKIDAPPFYGEPKDISPPGWQTRIRLILLTMGMLTPYCDQIVQMRLTSDHMDFPLHLLELITTQWRTAPRLVEVSFTPRMIYRPVMNRLSRLALVSTELDSLHVRRRRAFHPYEPAIITRLHNLDELTVPSIWWLNEELILPSTLCHLRVELAEFEVGMPKLYHFLISQSFRFLESLSIGCNQELTGVSHAAVKGLPTVEGWDPEEEVTLPSLRTLRLRGVITEHGSTFLKCLRR